MHWYFLHQWLQFLCNNKETAQTQFCINFNFHTRREVEFPVRNIQHKIQTLNLTVLFNTSWQFLCSFAFSLLHALHLYCTCHDTLRQQIQIIRQQRKMCHFTQSRSQLGILRGDWRYFKTYQLLARHHDGISKYKNNVFCHNFLTEGIFAYVKKKAFFFVCFRKIIPSYIAERYVKFPEWKRHWEFLMQTIMKKMQIIVKKEKYWQLTERSVLYCLLDVGVPFS